MAKLILTLESNSGKEDLFRELLTTCSTKTGVSATVNEAVSSADEYMFTIDFDTAENTICFIDQMFFQIEAPDEGHEDLIKSDFSIFSDGEDKKVSSYLTTRLHKSLQYDIQLLDMVASSIAEDTEFLNSSQDNVKKRLTSVEEYLKKSGIIYYQQFMTDVVDVLGDAGFLDKEKVKNKLFNTLH